MRIWMGWLILLPFAGAWWLTIKIVDACIKKGGPMRLLGVIVSFLVGGGSIAAGYFIGPIVGWFIMGIGALVLVRSAWASVVVPKPTKAQMEQEWLWGLMGKGQLGKQEQEKWDNMWISAKEEAKKMLKQDEIDDYERFSLVRSTLASRANDSEFDELYYELNKLEWKSTIKEAQRMIEQGKINMHNKKERERFDRVWLEVKGREMSDRNRLKMSQVSGEQHNPDPGYNLEMELNYLANELLPQLQKLRRDSETRNGER